MSRDTGLFHQESSRLAGYRQISLNLDHYITLYCFLRELRGRCIVVWEQSTYTRVLAQCIYAREHSRLYVAYAGIHICMYVCTVYMYLGTAIAR